MNIEDYREYCLSLGEDIEEKLPFQKFKNGEGVLVFYVMGHMFSFFDCNDFSVISLKCQPERIEDLKAQYECIGNPYNESPKHWIGINPTTAPDDLLKELTRNSYISNCTVMLMDGRFNAIDSVVTDSVGFYLMNGIKSGKYMALTAIKWDEYVRFSKFPEHGITVDVKPEHLMEKVLYATDELTGLIWAAALMRPSKSVQDMELKSLKKKYKSKGFASQRVLQQAAHARSLNKVRKC